MSALFISLFTLVLILISAFVILLVLMQRTSQSGGMGAALGGGAAESAFGSDTSNILTKGTIYGIIAFFLVALGLFLMYQSEASNRTQIISADELISAEKMAPAADTVVEESVVEGTAGTVVEDVVAIADDSAVTIEALVESVEVVAPVVDADASSVETVPTSN
ncbi:MAG: preprotein translocase subunit SecG [Opitutae bacterium]|jgi:preprotein translocase subunit SecG|nr:preprotein translocase subunit SecG [Opitutae bacterium]